MDDLLPSLITFASLIAAAVWYLFTLPGWRLSVLITALAHAILCLFGGFMFSAAVIKFGGGFDTPLIPALLVAAGTAICVTAHALLQKRRKTRQQQPLAE